MLPLNLIPLIAVTFSTPTPDYKNYVELEGRLSLSANPNDSGKVQLPYFF
jgi:hypothetical protein